MTETKAQKILDYWLGHAETSLTPSSERWELWFGKNPTVDQEIQKLFTADLESAIAGQYRSWLENPRSCLALIILFDQISRIVYRNQVRAFQQDAEALNVCLQGIEKQHDHHLTLLERLFFYMPLVHAENMEMQILSVRAYQMLSALSFPETRATFENFLDYVLKHYTVIEKFGRFPQRNAVLGRPSTPQELEFTKDPQNLF